LLLFPQAIAASLTMQVSGRLLDRFGPRLVVVPGLFVLCVATWLLSGLDLNTPDNTIRTVLFLRGCAMGLVMMPTTAVSMDTIPPHLISRATALTNVLRQLFSAFGTGMFATVLTFREQFHHANLVQDVTPTNLAAVRVLTATQTAMLERGLSNAAALAAGLNALISQVDQTAKVRSFDDCFLIATTIALCGLVPAFCLKRGQRPAAAKPDAALDAEPALAE
jgi:MFS family permease